MRLQPPAGHSCSRPEWMHRTGPRPIVLDAHGTSTEKAANIADFADSIEGSTIAAVFAAQGFIVVAPNYAGYDISSLALSSLPQRRSAVKGYGPPGSRPHGVAKHDHADHH